MYSKIGEALGEKFGIGIDSAIKQKKVQVEMKIYVRQHSETDFTGVEFDRLYGMVITHQKNHSLFVLTSSVESFIQYVDICNKI